jgi:hypothetical protein
LPSSGAQQLSFDAALLLLGLFVILIARARVIVSVTRRHAE